MPEVVPRELKSEKSIANEPDKLSSKIQVIIALDICGYTGNQIAEKIGMTASRVSIIRNSPLFIQERDAQRTRLQSQVIDKKSTEIATGDPVENRIKELALKAVGVYENIIDNGRGEMAKIASANSILDRAGYKPHTDKTVLSVEVTEKMADRFERVLKRTTVTRES
jgi:hypothetical protein